LDHAWNLYEEFLRIMKSLGIFVGLENLVARWLWKMSDLGAGATAGGDRDYERLE
jgi:hypothetical protein